MYDERIVYKNGSYMHECYSTTCETLRKGGEGGYTNSRGTVLPIIRFVIMQKLYVWWICVNNDVKYGSKTSKTKLDK